MKELKLADGKFTLEGKVVEAKPTRLITLKNYKAEDLISSIVSSAEKEENAYVIGEMIEERWYFWDLECHPVLYLKIKEDKNEKSKKY